ncbi:hypothetical protein ACOBV9_18495 (plasmid) [Pseudoalteromonas espejiana]
MPAPYQDELKQLLVKSFKQLFPKHVEHLLFYGAVGANTLVQMAGQKKWSKANVMTIVTTYKS